MYLVNLVNFKSGITTQHPLNAMPDLPGRSPIMRVNGRRASCGQRLRERECIIGCAMSQIDVVEQRKRGTLQRRSEGTTKQGGAPEFVAE